MVMEEQLMRTATVSTVVCSKLERKDNATLSRYRIRIFMHEARPPCSAQTLLRILAHVLSINTAFRNKNSLIFLLLPRLHVLTHVMFASPILTNPGRDERLIVTNLLLFEFDNTMMLVQAPSTILTAV